MEDWMGWGEAIKRKFIEMPPDSILACCGAITLISLFIGTIFATEIVRDLRKVRELEYKAKYDIAPKAQVREK